MLLGCVARHALCRPRVYTLEDRLAMLPHTGLPVERPVTILWNRHHVPFIEAETDADLAVTLGVVHAHLRLGQLELMRRLAQGGVAELIGSAGIAVDQLSRTLDFGRAVPAILAGMPPATRAWLEAFASGLNHAIMHARPLPMEFDLFDLRPEPWSIADILTLGRLVGADVNWIVWFQLLRFRDDAEWPRFWRKLLAAGSISCGTNEDGSALRPWLDAARCSWSNSFVVAPSRSATGGALIASDPHLSIILPSPWLLAAFKSPSFHAAGMMVPGLPFVALGRNPWIGWGGTSLHAASSDLVTVPAKDEPGLAHREVELKVRWQQSHRIQIRESQWGPVVTDVPLLSARKEMLALRWMGHRPSDEITAMLAVNRARSWSEFRMALESFAVPGQNMLCADVSGHIGRLMAVHLPRRTQISDDMATQPEADDGWDASMTSAALPCLADPADGFIASANERPPDGSPFIGRHFSPPDRKQRLDRLLAAEDRISFETAAWIQRDVVWAAALPQCLQLLAWLDVPGMKYLNSRGRRFVDDIMTWDGRYDATSRGALAFETLCHHLAKILVPARRRTVYGAGWSTRRLIWDDVLSADPARRQRALRQALHRAANAIGARETWGNRHRLRLSRPLVRLPLVGRAWRMTDLPAAGSSDTLRRRPSMSESHRLVKRVIWRGTIPACAFR